MRKFHGMTKIIPFFSIYDNKERKFHIPSDEIHYIVHERHKRIRCVKRGLRLNLIFIRIMEGILHAISIDISCACSLSIADRQSCRHLVRFGLYCRLYSDCNSDIIDRRHCEIHKPIARFIAPSPSLESPFLWRRPVFCDRRLTPPSLSTPPRRHPLSFRRRVR